MYNKRVRGEHASHSFEQHKTYHETLQAKSKTGIWAVCLSSAAKHMHATS